MSISKSQIKLIRSLNSKKFRDLNNLFVVEGDKLLQEAIDSGWEIDSVYRKEDIGEELMSKITHLSSPSPVLAVVKQREFLIDSTPSKSELFLVLDSVRDPGNLGTIIRIADWFGIKQIICSLDSVDLYNSKVVQSSMGAIFRVPVIYTDIHNFIKAYPYKDNIYGTFLDGQSIYSESLSDGGIIIMGSESFGISQSIEGLVKKRLNIPSFAISNGGSESLNVAVATAIVCSEFRRLQIPLSNALK